MSEKYLFIIWNKALFCKQRVLNDLSKYFTIDKYFYVEWDDELFSKNIKAFYGIKTNNVEEKIKYIGKGPFLVILATDNTPNYSYRKTYFGQEKVNTKSYDCKHLYRKWTGGNFRIHSTQNEFETKHDLAILFGPNYNNFVNTINQNDCIKKINTVGVYDFLSIDDFINLIRIIDNSYIGIINQEITIFANIKENIKSLLLDKTSVIIDALEYQIKIYGEQEGDLPEGFINKMNDKMFLDFVNIENEYDDFIKDNDLSNENLCSFFNKYGLNRKVFPKETTRAYFKKSILERIKNSMKYALCILKYHD